jgi:P27 family predicted phage terminase small subunit
MTSQRGRKNITKLALVSPNPTYRPTPPEVPSHLGKPERDLWKHYTEEHDFSTTASVSLLTTALEAHLRARECREQIKKDGLIYKNEKGVLKPHPLLATERGAQALYIATMKKVLKLEQ